MAEKADYELALARTLLRRHFTNNEELTPICKPDAAGQVTRAGGVPDYVFQDSAGNRYVFELTRLLPPRLRQIENFVQKQICQKINGRLPGTFTLEVAFEKLSRSGISLNAATGAVAEMSSRVDQGSIQDRQTLLTGFNLVRVRNDGNSVIPLITTAEMPYKLQAMDPLAVDFEREFEKIVTEANSKFIGYQGNRVLLIDICQSGFNWEYHASVFRDGKGVILHWIDKVSGQLNNVDAIVLYHFFIAQGPDMRIMLTGHKYVDTAVGRYIQVWPEFRIVG